MDNNIKTKLVFLDCTLRDGGYYNHWDFSPELINRYLKAMSAVGVDVVELGFRSLKNDGFKGACAFTTDDFIRTLTVPSELILGVMINASELIHEGILMLDVLERLFPEPASSSPVSLIRIACHVHEFEKVLPVSRLLKERGFQVGFNLMQIADRSLEEIDLLAKVANSYSFEVLYFADSMGGMSPGQTCEIIKALRKHWSGPLGIHTHDNMGMALQNSLCAIAEGVTWIDSTVTGMGRGPGNAKTEYLAIEIAEYRKTSCNLTSLMDLIRDEFRPMQHQFGWGTNSYYYLAGKYGIHPTYVQEMLNDARYREEDILTVINHLRCEDGKKFNVKTIETARHFYQGSPQGSWEPASAIQGREVLLLGSGPSAALHRLAIENYIRRSKPFVIALNTQEPIAANLIDARVACHSLRLLADCEELVRLSQPLITPFSMLPEDIQKALSKKEILDYGFELKADTFVFESKYSVLPCPLVVAYALAIASSGKAKNILLAGFDGYRVDDPRAIEIKNLLNTYKVSTGCIPITSITSTQHPVVCKSIYGL